MTVLRSDPALASNTLVVFTSDNGPWLIEGLNGGSAGLFYEGKGSTWEGGQRVPAIFWWPGRIASGVITPEMGSHVDIFTTLVTIGGGSVPSDRPIDGLDLSPLLFSPGGSGKSPRDYYFYWRGQDEYLPNGTLRTGLWAARKGPYKVSQSVTE